MINICEMKSSTVVGIMESLDVSGKGLMTDSISTCLSVLRSIPPAGVGVVQTPLRGSGCHSWIELHRVLHPALRRLTWCLSEDLLRSSSNFEKTEQKR